MLSFFNEILYPGGWVITSLIAVDKGYQPPALDSICLIPHLPCFLRLYSLRRYRLIGIGIAIINPRRLRFIIGIFIPTRRRLVVYRGPGRNVSPSTRFTEWIEDVIRNISTYQITYIIELIYNTVVCFENSSKRQPRPSARSGYDVSYYKLKGWFASYTTLIVKNRRINNSIN